ncbi:hypothetical protein NCCP2716_28080 [Sporosarcina sp. NCCP-2716]|uniref:sensor domain-containing diguanylate cyclase n=1 Tax=Sporosarcina sp. NCCP-2716 TaxID=2943679 RepID=UPI00203A4775|nr:sensor domain-containing diguanylate cyclase [Sporosarcina sp. NCCP-2716]GKV70310.1 hypothetical protein NCCP2716_28080 [Sporosarcina sp. NCCP-2716]
MDERLDHAPCGFLSMADDGRITEVNQTLCGLLGYTRGELEGRLVSLLMKRESIAFYQLYFVPMIRMQDKVEAMYLALLSKSGEEVPVLLNACRRIGSGGPEIDCGSPEIDCICFPMKERYEYEKALLTVKQETDERNRLKKKQIAELECLQKELEAKQQELLVVNDKLRKLADTDGLTGLRNRRSFHEHLTEAVRHSEESRQPVSLLLIDIDNFKLINDTYGHLVGDSVLQEMGRLLTEEAGTDNVAARYGGEEFALVLPASGKSAAVALAERIRSLVEKADWASTAITVSIGAATSMPGSTELALQEDADRALYASKNAGRNRVTHANHSIRVQ